MVKKNWKPIEIQSTEGCMFQMMENLLKIKKLSKQWGRNQRSLDQKELKEVEQNIQSIYSSNNTRVFSVTKLDELRMEEEKCSLLLT